MSDSQIAKRRKKPTRTPPAPGTLAEYGEYVGNTTSGTRALDASRRAMDPPVSVKSTHSDELCTSNALIGLIAVSHQVFNDVTSLNVSPTRHTGSLESVYEALRGFKLSIQLLYKMLRRCEVKTLELDSRRGLIELDHLIVFLSYAVRTLNDVCLLLLDLENDTSDLVSAVTVLCARHGEAFRQHAVEIVKAEEMITNMLGILQINSETEAGRKAAKLDATITEIVESDLELLDGLADMRDPYSALNFVSRDKIDEISSQVPPPYSESSVQEDGLPQYATNSSNATGTQAESPERRSVYSGITLADIETFSLVGLPISGTDLCYGDFYSFEYCRKVNEPLGKLAEANRRAKAEDLAEILALRRYGEDKKTKGFAGLRGFKTKSKRIWKVRKESKIESGHVN